MKLFQILMIWACALQVSFAQTFMVPDAGSVWKSTTFYPATDDGRPSYRQTEIIRVDRLLDGRPVFAGNMYGIDGEMIEGFKGTIVYAKECKNDVPRELLAPPAIPNQCVWGVCQAPAVGETFTRAMTIYAPIFNCQPQPAAYKFRAVRKEKRGEIEVTVGNAEITFKGVRRGAWESHIQKGIGEVFAESPEKVTTYDEVSVPLIPYAPPKKPQLGVVIQK
jgi:hypothetical protein